MNEVLSNGLNTEKVNLSREQQLAQFGYITGKDLTKSEIAKLDRLPAVICKRISNFKNVKQTSYFVNVYITPRLIIRISLKDESQYNSLLTYYNCDTEHFNEFEVKIPVRLFVGNARKTNKPYYQYEVFLAALNSGNWFIRKYFKIDQIILIENDEQLLSKFFTKNSSIDEEEINDVA